MLLYWIIAAVAFVMALGSFIFLGLPIVYAQIFFAIALSMACKKKWFFVFLQVILCPIIVFLLDVKISPWFYLFIFFFLFLIFRNVYTEKVPFFISTNKSLFALVDVVQEKKDFVDLGCGTGSVLFFMANKFPHLSVIGVENSLILYCIAFFRRCFFKHKSRVKLIFGSIWDIDICENDCVYVYLSSAPMGKIWEKFCNQAGSDAILISNTFLIPNVPYDEEYHSHDKIGSRIYVWKNKRRAK